MNINYTWEFTHFHVVPSLHNQTNVVTKIAFTLHGEYTNELGQSFREFWSGATLIEYNENSSYITLDQITYDMAVIWVEAAENKKQRNVDWIKAKVASRLQEKINPTLLVITPPFAQN
jgi:hypothetical protein